MGFHKVHLISEGPWAVPPGQFFSPTHLLICLWLWPNKIRCLIWKPVQLATACILAENSQGCSEANHVDS